MKMLTKLLLLSMLLITLCSAAKDEQKERYQKASEQSQKLRSYLFSDGAPQRNVYEDKQGYLWGTGDKGLVRFNGSTWQEMDGFLLEKDRGAITDIFVTQSKDIILTVEDGIYKWLGHGFKKYQLPEHEKQRSSWDRQQVHLDGDKIMFVGDKGFSVLDHGGLRYYYADVKDVGVLRMQRVATKTGSHLSLINWSSIFCDSSNKLWELRSPTPDPAIKNPQQYWQKELQSGLYLQQYGRGARDSLLLMDPATFADHFDELQSREVRQCGKSIVLGLTDSSLLYQINLDKKAVTLVPVPEGMLLNGIRSGGTHSSVLASFRKDNELLIRKFTEQPDGSLEARDWSFIAGRPIDEFKAVHLIYGDRTFSFIDSYEWTNKAEDYLFLKVKDNKVFSHEHPRLFDSRLFSRDTRLGLMGNSLVLSSYDYELKLTDVKILNLLNGQITNYSLPEVKQSYSNLLFRNDLYALMRSSDRLWRLDLEEKLVVEQDFQAAVQKYGDYSYLANEEPLVVWIDSYDKLGGAILAESEDGSLEDVHSSNEDARNMGYSKSRHSYYYQINEPKAKQVYSVDLKSGRRSLILSTNENSIVRMRNKYIVSLSRDELIRIKDNKVELNRQNPGLLDSLKAWSQDNEEYMGKLFEDFNYTVLNDGRLWHSGNSYQLAGEVDLDSLTGRNQKHCGSLKLRSEAGKTQLDLPAFLYDPDLESIQMFPNVIRMWEINAVPWVLYYEDSFPGPLKLGKIRDSEIIPIAEQPDISLMEDDVTRIYLYEDSDYPMVFIKETLYYRFRNEWKSKSFPKSQLGWYPIVKRHHEDIWISSTGGLLKFSLATGVVSKLDLGIGLIEHNTNIWFKDDFLFINADHRIYKMQLRDTAAKVMIPWLSMGTHRYLIDSQARLKYHQNNIRIPIDIFNETYPEKCRIKYKLYGYDEDWQLRPYNSMLEYRKLRPGKYSFELLAITPDGSETKPVVFSFRIVPPLWANTYAYMLYVLLIAGSIYALFRYRTRALALQKLALEETVAQRTSELREKQESMMQSIEYASLIQSSILPLEAELHSVIPRHFIIFRPRDGVSGDFYWLHQEEGHYYLALIDCTGHGVPGALIAVTVNSILNSLVKDRGIKEPKDILTLAHQEIGRLLHQQSSYNQQDGFEIALLRVEPDLRKICFAGAKRPLYLYSEDKMLKISANRYAIGGLKWHEKLLFTSTTFSYQPQTLLYLFSDGIVDQPHPAFGCKLGSARWLELLSENATMPIAEQEQSINNLLQQMLEYSDQRDDITIIGLELP